ncbi:hypothetical protein [Robertkochia solimangrovi]|uniref:hypothetical protein n=1 Tax=Robertkochia solimangrovi TaxID=2213046 RepID=UPI00118062C9|nr:hypothetical protein [Robertkochia solimangrovi]TRZ46088.1 hypothetical protein DMZ48_02135 [Robertkochia solimangrovi]
MEQEFQISILLRKYIKGLCSSEETEQVIAYFRAQRITDAFPEIEEIEALLQELPKMKRESADRIFDTILCEASTAEPTNHKLRRFPTLNSAYLISMLIIMILVIALFIYL